MDKNPAPFNPADFVRITNDTDAIIEGRYAGQDYEFQIGKPVDVTLAVAHHIFGFMGDEQARLRAFSRLGWIQVSTDIKAAQKRLEKVRFTETPNIIDFDQARTNRVGPQAGSGAEGAAGRLVAPEDPLNEDDEEAAPGERM